MRGVFEAVRGVFEAGDDVVVVLLSEGIWFPVEVLNLFEVPIMYYLVECTPLLQFSLKQQILLYSHISKNILMILLPTHKCNHF